MTDRAPQPKSPTSKRQLGQLGPWLPPVVALLVVLLLGGLKLQGSSLGLYGVGIGASEDQSGVLTGPARPIRSDEWFVRTPWVLAQDRNGLPAVSNGGIGQHDPALIGDLPTAGWEVIVRPHTLPYHLIDGPRTLALEWWLLYAVQFLGVYALVLAVSRSWDLALMAGLLMIFSPVTQWWTGSGTYTPIGYGGMATALLIWAYRATDHRRWLYSGAAGLSLGAFAVGLYPPWQIGALIVAGSLAIGVVAPDLVDAARRRNALVALASAVLPAAVIGGGLFLVFILKHTEAVEAVSGTVYPGERGDSAGGFSSLPSILSAPFDSFASAPQFALVNGTNQSENSSGVLYLIPVGVIIFAIGLTGSFRGRLTPAIKGLLVGSTLLFSWMLFPLPSWLGRPVLLNRVEAGRIILPLTFASVVALALLLAHLRETNVPLPRLAIVGALVAFVIPYAWAAGKYAVEGAETSHRQAALFLVILSAGLGLAFARPRLYLGPAILVLFGFWQASLINPIQEGIGTITQNALYQTVDKLVTGDRTESGWVSFGADGYTKGTITASGVDHLSGISPYPDHDAWAVLDPTGANEDVWNRYAHVGFEVGAPGSEPAFRTASPDSIVLTIDPCDDALVELGVDFIVMNGVELEGCGRLAETVTFGASTLFIYQR